MTYKKKNINILMFLGEEEEELIKSNIILDYPLNLSFII